MKKRKKLGAERLSEFFRQFSVLVESGLSIPETLEIMQQALGVELVDDGLDAGGFTGTAVAE